MGILSFEKRKRRTTNRPVCLFEVGQKVRLFGAKPHFQGFPQTQTGDVAFLQDHHILIIWEKSPHQLRKISGHFKRWKLEIARISALACLASDWSNCAYPRKVCNSGISNVT